MRRVPAVERAAARRHRRELLRLVPRRSRARAHQRDRQRRHADDEPALRRHPEPLERGPRLAALSRLHALRHRRLSRSPGRRLRARRDHAGEPAQPLLSEPVLRREVGHRVSRARGRGGARRLLRVVRARHGLVDPQDRRARHRHDAARRQARLSRGPRGGDARRRRDQHAERRRGDGADHRRLSAGVDVPAAGAGAARLHRRRARGVSLLRSRQRRRARGRRRAGHRRHGELAAARFVLSVRRQRRGAEAPALARRLLRGRRSAADAVGRAPRRLRALRRAQRILRPAHLAARGEGLRRLPAVEGVGAGRLRRVRAGAVHLATDGGARAHRAAGADLRRARAACCAPIGA